MNLRDCLELGLKLLGVYFGVVGAVYAVSAIANVLLVLTSMGPSDFGYGSGFVSFLIPFAHPAGYLGCAFILTRRTDWCMLVLQQNRRPTHPTEIA